LVRARPADLLQEAQMPVKVIVTRWKQNLANRSVLEDSDPTSAAPSEVDALSSPPYPCGTAAATVSGHSATHLIHRAEQCAADLFARITPKGMLTPRQFAILVAIQDNEGISQTGLVEVTGIDRSTLADIMRRMIEKGLVQRRRTNADARTYAVRLTRRGSSTLRKMRPYAEEVDRQIVHALPEEYRDMFLTVLNRLVSRLTPPDGGSK
jgi:MarR family transcriptional regulator, temperature-dependent positive regulator of motility